MLNGVYKLTVLLPDNAERMVFALRENRVLPACFRQPLHECRKSLFTKYRDVDVMH